jgi:maltose alpha-D-glucosyltransferase/alpha-amylase
MLKIYRRLESGIHPEIEMPRFLREHNFAHALQPRGLLEYRPTSGEPMALGVLYDPLPTEGDAWQATLTALHTYFTRALTGAGLEQAPPDLLDAVDQPVPAVIHELAGLYLETVRLLGQRTAEMHLALTTGVENDSFAPEPFTLYYQRSLYQTLRNHIRQTFGLLREYVRGHPEAPAEWSALLDSEAALLRRHATILEPKIASLRLRLHTNYELRQLLYTGKDFVITGFDGDATRHLSYRRRKGSPLRDLSTLLHSLHLAALTARMQGSIRPEDVARLEPWVEAWRVWVGGTLLAAYLKAAEPGGFLPPTRAELHRLIDYGLLRRAVHEVRDALLHRLDHLPVAVQALAAIVRPPAAAGVIH